MAILKTKEIEKMNTEERQRKGVPGNSNKKIQKKGSN